MMIKVRDITNQYVGHVRMIFESYRITKQSIEIYTDSSTVALADVNDISEKYTVYYNGENLGEFTAQDNDCILPNGQRIVIVYSHKYTSAGTYTNIPTSYYIMDAYGNNVSHNYKVIWHYGTIIVG